MDFFEKLREEHGINLTEQQKEAVINIYGHTLVLAVPGAGKTQTLLCRIAYMIDQGINPKDILTVTFGKASTKDMAERFEKLFGSEYNVRFSTIHSLAYSILREYNYKHRINVTLIEEKDDKAGERPTKTKVLRQIYRIVNDAFITDEEIEDLANKVGFVKNMMLKKNEFWKYNLGIKNFEEIFEKYERYKRKNSFIDYDDMLTMCLDILGKDRKILEKYQYKFIQVDEAQDTSKVQHEIIRVLGSKSRNIFYVADDDQSIYGFRGAYPEFLLSIKDTYEDVKVLYMEQNFRSTPEIVSACNEFIKENEVRFNKEMFTENPSGKEIIITTAEDKTDQLLDLAGKLKYRNTNITTAVLYRNNISAVSLVDLLSKAHVPFKLKGFKNYFFDHWMLDDVFSIINVGLNNKDIKSFEKIYYKLSGYFISKNMIEAIKFMNQDLPIFDRMMLLKITDYQKDNVMAMKRDFAALKNKTPEEMLNIIKNGLEYNKLNKSNYIIFSTLKLLSQGLKTVEELREKIENLKLIMQNAVYNKDNNPVVLSTSHSSKGLEWDKVYIIDAVNGTFPTYSSFDEAQRGNRRVMEEERRLFYVSMTRARKEIVLYSIKNYYSLFIDEVYDVMEKLEMRKKVMDIDKLREKQEKEQNLNKPEEKDLHRDAIEFFNIKKPEEYFGINETEKLKESLKYFDNQNIYIKHKKLGVGLIKKFEEGILHVMFEDNTIKSLSFDFCCKNNLIKLYKKDGV